MFMYLHLCRWEDIVMDLTCESPQCFNIRHAERGIQTRKTRKQGGNLHCIMAFQMQEPSKWDAVDIIVSPEPPKVTSGADSAHRRTPIESLNSSESDFPLDTASEVDVSEDDDGFGTLRRDNAAKFRAWSDKSASVSSIESSGKNFSIEDVDASQSAAMPPLPKAVELSDNDQHYSEQVIDTEDILNLTLTPPKAEEEFGSAENEMTLMETLEPVEGDYTRRSGTYRKNKPSLMPVPVVESEHQLETAPDEAVEESNAVTTGPYTRRSGTFRKEKPSLVVTQQADITAVEVDQAQGHVAEDDRGFTSSSNISLQIEPSLTTDEEPDLHNSETHHSDELVTHEEGTGLKRSSTFKKEKPTLQVSPILRMEQHHRENRSNSTQPVDFDYMYTNKPPGAAADSRKSSLPVSLMVPDPHTYVVYPDSDSTSDSVESYVLVDSTSDGAAGGGERKRGGTFSKEKPALENSPFGDEYF